MDGSPCATHLQSVSTDCFQGDFASRRVCVNHIARARGTLEAACPQESFMKVILRNPRREIEIEGRRRVHGLLAELGLPRESHLVIRNGTLVPGDEELDKDDVIEIRPVISGGM